MSAPLSELLSLCHLVLERACAPGDCVLDATAGRGHDTLFLASLVGESGLVLAVDRQEKALRDTASLLCEHGLEGRVRLTQGDHAEMEALLCRELPADRDLAAVVFNLGFLPGSDKIIRTSAASTSAALKAVWPRLRRSGLLCVHVYTGHEGAEEEAAAVDAWMRALDWKCARVTACGQRNKPSRPETLYLVHKRESLSHGA